MVTGGAAQSGSLFEPTVLTDVTTDMVITKGGDPLVAALYRFKTETIKMAADAPTLSPLAGR